jgi:hypothetical protein
VIAVSRRFRSALLIAALAPAACSDAGPTEHVEASAPTSPSTAPLSTTSSTSNPSTMSSAPPSSSSAPALTAPTDVPACRAEDLEYASGAGLSLLRFFNRSGTTCGLAGYPELLGRTTTGSWQPIATTRPRLAPTNGPQWNGAFTTDLTAVISIRASDAAACSPHAASVRYSALRLRLPGTGTDIDVPLAIDVSECPLQITPFAADSQDR